MLKADNEYYHNSDKVGTGTYFEELKSRDDSGRNVEEKDKERQAELEEKGKNLETPWIL